MKTAEQYLRENGISMIDYNNSADYPSVVKAIQQAQQEAYLQGISDKEFDKEELWKEGRDAALNAASRVIDGWPNQILTISEQQEAILELKNTLQFKG